jgi:hypothetical protein
MDNIILEEGFSYYKEKRVSDLELCNLVGLETYKALYELFPNLWVSVTYPMEAQEDHKNKIKVLLSLQDKLSGECLKRRLIVRLVDGTNQSASELVAGLINSSEPLSEPIMTPTAWSLWILFIFIFTVLTVLVFWFYIWPDIRNFYYNRKYHPETAIIPGLMKKACG